MLSHDTERPELCTLAAPRRLADDDIALMRMALAAGGGLLPTQFCHGDDLGLRLRSAEAALLRGIT